MIALTTTNSTLVIVLSNAISTSYSFTYGDKNDTAVPPSFAIGTAEGSSSAVGTITAVTAPASGVQRLLKGGWIANNGASNQIAQIVKVVGALNIPYTAGVTIPPGQTLRINEKGELSLDSSTNVIIAGGKTFTVLNTLTLQGTDGATLDIGGGGALGKLAFVSDITKTVDSSLTSQTTLQNDPELTMTLLANSTYEIEIYAEFYASNATPNFKFATTFAGTITNCTYSFLAMPMGSVSYQYLVVGANRGTSMIPSTSVSITAAGMGWLRARMVLQVGASGGAFRLQWAQQNTSTSATICCLGSSIRYRKIA
jgi:hypothetical protein